MKTTEERNQICSVCKKRKFLTTAGIVCSLTDAKADFENDCQEYEEDEVEKRRVQAQKEEYAKDPGISGWLAFFLAVGVGVSAVISLFRAIAELGSGEVGSVFGVLYAGYMLAYLITAVYTITAFVKRLPNAVAVAKTYIGMIFLEGVLLIISCVLSDNNESLTNGIRNLIWAVTWFSYLEASTQVQTLIPPETRKWGGWEKLLGGLYIVMCLGMYGLVFYSISDESGKNFFLSNEKYIEQAMTEANASLPAEIAEGLTMEMITKDKDSTLCYRYRFSDLSEADFDVRRLKEAAIAEKYAGLKNFCESGVENEFMKIALEENYTLKMMFKGDDGKVLYEYSFSPQEYSLSTSSETYVCPDEAYEELIKLHNSRLPDVYMEDCLLERVAYNKEECAILYKINLPEMSYSDLMEMTSTYLKEYLLENWDMVSSDSIISLAALNEMTIQFDFCTVTGRPYLSVKILPEEYVE